MKHYTMTANPICIKKPQGVPESNMMIRETIYVRDCYLEYYDKIQRLLATTGENRVVQISVTGTPGIGKSAFYLYFLTRYAEEHPDSPIVTAAFSRERKLILSRLWRAGGSVFEDRALASEQRGAVHTTNCLHLYDGPPASVPMLPTKVVCFTYPNDSWFTEALKWEGHAKLFMPNWDFDELCMANDALSLNLSRTDLSKRIMLFGGAARYVLTQNARTLEAGMEAFEDAFDKVETIGDVRNCFAKKPVNPEQVVHRLMHYRITTDDCSVAVLVPGSVYIAERLMSSIEKSLDNKREQIMQLLDGVGKASPFWGWLYENHAHDALLRGGTFLLRSLDDNSVSDFMMPPTVGTYKRFKLTTDVADIFKNAYRIMDASSLAAIDSYALIGDILYLFQITKNMDHSLSTEGIIGLLEYLDRLDSTRKDLSTVRIVFVVPDEMKENFPKQRFECAELYDGMDHTAILSSKCDKIPGIKVEKRKVLEGRKIRTVEQLLDARKNKDGAVSFVHSVTSKFMENMKRLADYQSFKQIPQFVVGVKYVKDDRIV